MQHFYAYTQKSTGSKASYRTLFLFFGKLLLIITLAFLAMLLNITKSNAQGQLDPTFNIADNSSLFFKEGADRDVRAIAVQADGKIIIGGNFLTFSGSTVNRIARLNPNGTLDASFNSGAGVDSTVNRILVQADGKIILAGAFTTFNGTTANRVVRLNVDGSLDASFNTGTGANNTINTIALQADGKLIAGGLFNNYNGTTSNYIVRLNTNGSKDGTFNPNILSSVNDVALQTDGKVLIGMNDDQNGLVTKFLVRVNSIGVNDAGFNGSGSGANGSVKSIKIQPDGKILFGGNFSSYNTANTNFTRVNTNGALDATFNNSSEGLPGGINKIALQADGKILVAFGQFFSFFPVGELQGKKITRFNSNGTTDVNFQFDFFPQLNENIYDIAIQSDGKILLAESLEKTWVPNSNNRYISQEASTVYASTRDFKIHRYNANGSRDQDFCIVSALKGANRAINAVTLLPDGKILIAGTFFSYNGVSTNYLARLNADGTKDATFNTGGIGFDKKVSAIVLQPDGKIIVGGVFTAYNGVECKHLIRLNADGTRDASFNFLPDSIEYSFGHIQISSLSLQPDGKIIAGGQSFLIRVNNDGSLDNSYNPNITFSQGYFFANTYTLSLQQDGKLIAAGNFNRVRSTTRQNIVRLLNDGTIDNGFGTNDMVPGTNGDVYASAIQTDQKILLAGAFTEYYANNQVTTVNRIARLNADGFADPTFNPGGSGPNDIVYSISLLQDNRILIAGKFTAYNGIAANKIALLNADGTPDPGFNPGGAGADLNIYALATQSGSSKIIIAGDFSSYNGNYKHGIARLFGPDAAAATSTTTNAIICASSLPYVWNGNNYNAAGTYTATVSHPGGSVSVDTLVLAVGPQNITGPDRACQFINNGTNATYQIQVPAGSTITWSVSKPASMQIVNGQGTGTVQVKYLGDFISGYVYAKVVNSSCGINLTKTYLVSKVLPSTPGVITASNTSICSVIGTSNTVTYTIRKVNSATSYNWVAQAGTTTITHPNGPGVNDTTVNISFAANFTTSTVTVQAVNDCGSSNTRILNISRANPTVPGAISGLTNVCGATGAMAHVLYSVPEVAGITYNWTLPAGATLLAYTNSSHYQVDVRFADSYTSGTISVTATNGCGTSVARSLTVRKLVSGTPGAITTTNSSTCPNLQYTYSIAAMPAYATYVQWAVPAGGTILSGQGTTSISVSYSSAINGYVSAQGLNGCSSSAIRKIAVNIGACPTGFAKEGNGTPATSKTAVPGLDTGMMEVKIFPNPSVSDFKLQVNSNEKETINVRVFELQGRLLKEINATPGHALNIGSELKAGSYIIEVRQGLNIKTTKVIKF